MRLQKAAELELLQLYHELILTQDDKSEHFYIKETKEYIGYEQLLINHVEADRVEVLMDRKQSGFERSKILNSHGDVNVVIPFFLRIHNFKPMDRRRYRRRKKVDTPVMLASVPKPLYDKLWYTNDDSG